MGSRPCGLSVLTFHRCVTLAGAGCLAEHRVARVMVSTIITILLKICHFCTRVLSKTSRCGFAGAKLAGSSGPCAPHPAGTRSQPGQGGFQIPGTSLCASRSAKGGSAPPSPGAHPASRILHASSLIPHPGCFSRGMLATSGGAGRDARAGRSGSGMAGGDAERAGGDASAPAQPPLTPTVNPGGQSKPRGLR